MEQLEQMAIGMRDRALREVSEEKAKSVLRQAEIARVMEQMGSARMEGLGQKIGGVDPRTFFRWEQQYPGCWRNKEFIREFLRDNPACRAPGYTGHKR
jgi:hypothetical protein